jgi:chromosome segregation ATPase
MRKFAIILLCLSMFTAQIFAQDSQTSDTPAKKSECEGLARACYGAAVELKAARDLIAGYEQQITAADARIELARKEIDSLRQLSMLESKRAMELDTVIKAEREAKEIAVAKIKEQEKRIASLEKKAGRYKKFALIAGTAAVVAILIGARK